MQILLVASGGASVDRLQRYLEGAGHGCEVLAELRPAIDRLAGGGIEVVVLHDTLSKDSAFLLAATVRGKHRLVRVVAMVPEAEDGRGGQLEAVGVSQLVYAPASPLDVLDAVEASGAEAPTFTGYASVSPSEIAALEALRDHDPDNAESQWLLGFAYYRAERFRDAIPILEAVGRSDPNHAQAFYYLGSSFYRSDQKARAIEAWTRVLEAEGAGPLVAKARDRIERAQAQA